MVLDRNNRQGGCSIRPARLSVTNSADPERSASRLTVRSCRNSANSVAHVAVGGGSAGVCGGLAQAVRRELDKVAQEEDISRSDVLPQSLEDFLFVRRFRQLRQRMMAAAQAHGIVTDEDVFNRVS